MRANRFAILPLLATALLAAGCGSQTRTVSASESPPSSTAPASAATATTATASTPTAAAPAPARTTTGAAQTPTAGARTAPEPAFAEPQAGAGGEASAAAAVVRAHGYTPSNTAEYHPDQTLRVLVGTRSGSGDGYGQQAFFFVDGRFIGTDAKEPSASVKVVSQSDTEVTLAYPVYRHGDPLCCPGGGQATVHFELNNGMLVPVGQIPPASSSSGPSRY